MFGNKTGKHMKKHAVPPALQKYLGLGAFVIRLNEPTEKVLVTMHGPDAWQETLARMWNIRERAHLLERIEELLDESLSNQRYAEEFAQYREQDYTGPEKTNFEILAELAEGTAHIDQAEIMSCQSLFGWDLERAAFLVRAGFNSGFLEESEAWDYLQNRIAPLAAGGFASWQAYAMSYLLGRYFWSGSAVQDDACEAIGALLASAKKPENTGLWALCPLDTLGESGTKEDGNG